MAADEAKLRILIEAILDERGIAKAKDALAGVEKSAKQTGDQFKDSSNQLKGMGQAGTSLLGIFAKVGVVAAASVAPIVQSAKAYVSAVGESEETSRQWLSTTYDINQSQLKLGRTMAKEVLPFYQAYSTILEKITSYATNNPGQATMGMAIGGGATALGGISLLSKLFGGGKGLAAGGGLASLFGGGASAGAVGATTTAGAVATGGGLAGLLTALGSVVTVAVTVVGAVVALTATITGLVNIFKNPKQFAQDTATNRGTYKGQVMAGQVMPGVGEGSESLLNLLGFGQNIAGTTYNKGTFGKTSALYGVQGGLVGPPATGQGAIENETKTLEEWLKKLIETIKTSLGIGGADADKGKDFKSTQRMWKEYEFEKQELYAQEDFNRQRSIATQSFQRQLIYSEQDFYRQRAYAYRDFAIQQAFSEKMFYLQRAIAQRDFQISQARMDYDYQLSRKRAAEDHNFSLKQIMLSGDALAYYFAQRQYNIDKQRAEEDYQLRKSRAKEDFERQKGDSLMFFKLEREQARKEFEIHMADQLLEYEIMRARQIYEFNITLSIQDKEFAIMKARRAIAFQEQLAQLMDEAKQRLWIESQLEGAMYTQYNTMMANFINQWNAYWASASTYQGGGGGGTVTEEPFDKGGYSSGGRALLHSGEFVLTPATTRQAERVAQGTLTQDKILNLLTGGGSGLIYNDSRQFTRGLDPDEKVILKQELKQIVMEAFK